MEKRAVEDVPKKKTKTIEELTNLINNSNSIIIASIKNLPAKHFQLINKKLKDKAIIKVVKKNAISRAIDCIEKGTIKNLKKYLREDIALIFSKLELFELSAILSKNKSMARAKIGQVVEEDVFVESGPTELIPGPVVSELSSLGIKFSIEEGKINIRERKAIAKKGESVSEQAASIMTKLDIKPIAVGLEPLVAYDAKEDKIYENIKIDEKKTLEEIKTSARKAIALAVKIVYYCKDTIKHLLAKAYVEEKALEKFIKADAQQNSQNINGGYRNGTYISRTIAT